MRLERAASPIRRSTSAAVAALLLPLLPTPAADLCAELAIPGSYTSECMSQKRRKFSWPSVGEVLVEQGEVGPGTTGAAVWRAGERLADLLTANPQLVQEPSHTHTPDTPPNTPPNTPP